MKPQKLTSWSLIALLTLAASSSLAFVFLPRQRILDRRHQELTMQEHCVHQSLHLDAQLLKLDQELHATREYLTGRWPNTPSDSALLGAFGSIAREAQAAGVTTDHFQPQPDEDMAAARPPTGRRWKATLVTEGSFVQLFDLVGRLERLPVRLWIDEMKVQRGKDAGSAARCEMKLVIFAGCFEYSG
jgi:Tfp pilus assembly protein PilO